MQNASESNQIYKLLFAMMALFVTPISGLSIDIYVPSLPAVSHYFNIDKSLTQLTITSYMLGLGLMQLFGGGISDSFGRKKPFLIAMVIFIVATFCIPFSNEIYQLLFLRFIQGATIAVAVVAMRSVIPDLFEGRELYKMMNYMTMAWSIGPIIAPAIGGYLQNFYGWKANFYFLTGYSVLAFTAIALFMPETSQFRHPFNMVSLVKRYTEFLSHWKYTSGVMINSLLYSLAIIFSIVGPFLIQGVLHYSPLEFGYVALIIGLAWFLGATTNRFLINIDLELKMKLCFWAMLFIALIMLSLAVFLPMNLYTIIIPLFFLIWLGGIVFPNNFAQGISMFPKTTGSANALFGGLLFLLTGVSSGLSTMLKSTNQLPLTIASVGIIIVCLIIYYARKPLNFATQRPLVVDEEV